MRSLAQFFEKVNFIRVCLAVVIWLPTYTHGAIFRVQGHLKDPSGAPLQGKVYISTWPLFSSPPSDQTFSPPVTLGAQGDFDIQFDIGDNQAVAFHHYPVGRAPENENDLVRKWNNEFLIQLANEGGFMYISRNNGGPTMNLAGEAIYTFCGLDFKTSPYTDFLPITSQIPKNDWDGSRGWCPDDYEKLNTITSHVYPTGNLVKNGSFELNLENCEDCRWDGWNMYHTNRNNSVPDDFLAKTGKQFAHVHFGADATTLDAFQTEPIQVKPNTDYTLTFYYKMGNAINWDSQGARPMVRTYGEDGVTEVSDIISGRLGLSSYVPFTEVGWGLAPWNKYVHHFKTGPSAYFTAISLIRAAGPGSSADFYFDDVQLVEGAEVVPASPGASVSYSNPLGRVIQSWTNINTGDGYNDGSVVTSTKYDSLWRPIWSSLPINGFRTNACDDTRCITAKNGFLLYPDYALEWDYPEAGGYAFSETRFEGSPLGRLSKQSSPGTTWNLNSSHTKDLFYSTTSSLDPASDQPAEATSGSALYAYQLQVGEGGELSRTFTDNTGKVIRTSVKSETGWINTDYEHDISGNVSKTKSPPGPLGAIIETEFSYNSLGNKLSETSPDFGKNLFIYDDANRLRFTQSQAQRDAIPARFSYRKYDIFDRPIESGEYLDGAGFSLANANIASFPAKDDAKVRISDLNFYDHLPPNKNYCLEGGVPTTIVIRDDAPDGSTSEFRDWDAAYTYVRDQMRLISTHPGTIRFYQVFNSAADLVKPPAGKQYPYFILSDNLTTKGYTLNGILKGGSQYQQLVSNYPFSVDGNNLEGRLALAVSCNSELVSTPLGIQQISTVFNYDKYGNITQKYEFNGYVRDLSRQWQKTSFVYDLAKRLISKGTYSNVASTNPQFLFQYSYDQANRLTDINISKDGGNQEHVAYIRYNARGLPTYTAVGPMDYQKTLVAFRDYNIRGWLQTDKYQWNQDLGQSDKYLETMSYESGLKPQFNGNISSVSYTQAGERTKQVDYTYDVLDRLKIAQYLVQAGTSPSYSKEWYYNYHPNGTLNTVVKEGAVFSYSYSKVGGVQSNRLGGVGFTGSYSRNTNDPNNFTYDASGRMTSDLSKGMILHYGGQPVPFQFDYPDGTDEGTQVMVYADGVRKSKFVFKNGEFISATHYFSNGKEIREVSQGGTDVVKEIHSLEGYGRMIGLPDGNWDEEYFIRNHIGSTVAMVDVNGNTTYKTDYEPYGKIWQESQSQAGGEPLTEKFTGKEHDKGIDLDYFGARYYDEDLGVWISPDPARQFSSPYAYGPNPISSVDPDGRAQDVSRPLSLGLLSNGAFGMSHEIRHDYIAFDKPQQMDGNTVNSWGLYGDNGMYNKPGVFRPDQMPMSYASDFVKAGWIPDKFAVSAIEEVEKLYPTYNVVNTDQNCQGFARDVMDFGLALWTQYASDHNPLIVNLLDDE